MKLALSAIVLFAVALSACHGSQTAAESPAKAVKTPEPTKILELVPSSATLHAGESITAALDGQVAGLAWESSDPYVAKVDGTGRITGGHKSGTALITARTGTRESACAITNVAAMRDISPAEMVAEMKMGTNFARSMDCVGWDTDTGYDGKDYNKFYQVEKIQYYLKKGKLYIPSPQTLADMKAAGYDAVRLNVSYSLFTNDETFAIDRDFLDVLEETVNLFLDQGMYCIINSHYDYLGKSWVGDHWEANWMADQYKDYVDARFAAIWKQVAERFRDYDDHLIFEPMNEPAIGEPVNWVNGAYHGRYDAFLRDSKAGVSRLNDLFVKTVRATGGNNALRVLSISPMSQLSEYLDDFTPPKDGRLIVQVHFYLNYTEQSAIRTSWNRKKPADTKLVVQAFDRIKKFKEKTGLPVILGEWGNTECLPLEDRIDQATYIAAKAKELGVPAFWWESTTIGKYDPQNDRFSLYDRDTHQWYWPALADAIRTIAYDP